MKAMSNRTHWRWWLAPLVLAWSVAGAAESGDATDVIARAMMVKSLESKAHEGSAEAMNALGVLHAQGVVVRKNVRVAQRWFERSADAGSPQAMVNLGTMFAVGDSVRRDPGKAYAWLRAALYLDLPDEQREATIFKLGMVAGRMNVGQVRRAEMLGARIALAAAARREKPEESSSISAPAPTAVPHRPDLMGLAA